MQEYGFRMRRNTGWNLNIRGVNLKNMERLRKISNLYTSPNATKMKRGERMRWTVYAAHMRIREVQPHQYMVGKTV
jgi:hypothetical protein